MKRVWLLLVPCMGFLTIMTLFPLVYLVYLSVLNWNLLGAAPTFVGIANFAYILTPTSGVSHSILVTLEFAVTAIVIEFPLGLGVAFLIVRPNMLAKIATGLLIADLVMSPVVLDLTWNFLYDPAVGALLYLATLVGIKNVNFLGVWPNVFYSLIAVDAWQWTPFVTLILAAGIISLPASVYEAAMIDGASSWRTFRHITLPLLTPVILIVIMFRFVDALKVFNKIYNMTGGGPGQLTDTLSYHIYYYSVGFVENISLGATISLVFLILVLTTSVAILIAYRSSLSR